MVALLAAIAMLAAACGGNSGGEVSSEAGNSDSGEGADESPAGEPASDGEGESAEVDGWEPSRPITVVIGHGAGGGTDTVARASAAAVSEVTGWTFRYENREGSNGAVGMDYALSQPADGHTWLHTGSYHRHVRPAGTGSSVPWLDWHHFGISTTTASFSVRNDSEFEDLGDLVEAAIANPGSLKMANAGLGGSWHSAAVMLEQAAGVEFDHIPYDGGAPAALAVQQGEVDVVASGLHEQVEGLKSGDLRNLAVFTAEPVTVEGIDEPLTAVAEAYPELVEDAVTAGALGTIAIHRDTDGAVLQAVEKALDEAFAAMASGEAQQPRAMYDSNIITPILVTGTTADETAARLESKHLWSHVDLGIAQVDPEQLDHAPPRPAEFEEWWPAPEYQPSPLGEGLNKVGWGAWQSSESTRKPPSGVALVSGPLPSSNTTPAP